MLQLLGWHIKLKRKDPGCFFLKVEDKQKMCFQSLYGKTIEKIVRIHILEKHSLLTMCSSLIIKSDDVFFWQYVMSLASFDYLPSHLQRRFLIWDKLNSSNACLTYFQCGLFLVLSSSLRMPEIGSSRRPWILVVPECEISFQAKTKYFYEFTELLDHFNGKSALHSR
jgi:hypothetical protein